jgi:transcriptional regulator with PAS, ATPase and Fis domain
MKKSLSIEDIRKTSIKMKNIYNMVPELASIDAPILIQGEEGTEKELIARAIHLNSRRKNKLFAIFNCSAYPQELLEAELFGYEKGAFKGALKRNIGYLERSNGGTIFLDEIDKISPLLQAKLVRFLQTKEFERLGDKETIRGVDVRLIVSTTTDLRQEVEKATFSEALYYQINTISIYLPPLRQRKDDIKSLTQYFLERLSLEKGKTIKAVSPDVLQVLMDYSWPRNIKELENTIQYAFISDKDKIIDENDLPSRILNEISIKKESRLTSFKSQEKGFLIRALQKYNWNKVKVAKELSISRSTLYAKLKKYNITIDSEV